MLFFKTWMSALFRWRMIYLCLQCSSCNNRGQVYPPQHKWDKLNALLSLAGFRASSRTDLLPPSHWSQMNDECLVRKHTTARQTLYSLVFLSLHDLPTQWATAPCTVMGTQVCNLIVYISAKAARVSLTFFIPCARKVTAGVPSQSWIHEVIGCANGEIDSVTSAVAY